jgi:chromosome segregation ATPase
MHPRLTVAHVPSSERAALARLLAASQPSPIDGLELHGWAILTRADVLLAANEVAAAEEPKRRAELERIEAELSNALDARDVARERLDALVATIDGHLEDATWCDQIIDRSPQLLDELAQTTARADACRAAVRDAEERLQRVLEQRAAVSAAIDDAERELAQLEGASLDELDLRRELESAGRSVHEAVAEHQAAIARAEDARRTLDATLAEIASIDADLAGLQRERLSAAAVDRVAAALAALEENRRTAPSDRAARQLARAIERLDVELAEARASAPDLPDATDVTSAEQQLETAELRLNEVLADNAVLTADERAEIEAAHDAIVDAEERVERGFGRGSARRELDAARDNERAVLERFGFPTYIDYLLSGGRRQGDEATRAAAEQAVGAAQRMLSTLRAQSARGNAASRLEAERRDLVTAGCELVGVDAPDRVIELLDANVLVPQPIIDELASALDAVSARARHLPLDEAAAAWLATARHEVDDANTDRVRAAAHDARRAQLDPIAAEQRAELDRAETEVLSAAARVDAARRGAGGIEAEMAARAGGDAGRLDRIADARKLREQVTMLWVTLDEAEAAVRAELVEAGSIAAEAEAAWDRASNAIADIRRRALQLASQLPADADVDLGTKPLDGFASLATALRAAAAGLEREVEAAEGAVRGATDRADRMSAELQSGRAELDAAPTSADIVEGFATVLRGAGTALAVLDDPLIGSPATERDQLLEVLAEASALQPTVLLTDDPEVLGWAIALSRDVGGVATAAALAELAEDASRRDQLLPAPVTAALDLR